MGLLIKDFSTLIICLYIAYFPHFFHSYIANINFFILYHIYFVALLSSLNLCWARIIFLLRIVSPVNNYYLVSLHCMRLLFYTSFELQLFLYSSLEWMETILLWNCIESCGCMHIWHSCADMAWTGTLYIAYHFDIHRRIPLSNMQCKWRSYYVQSWKHIVNILCLSSMFSLWDNIIITLDIISGLILNLLF